MEDSKPILDRGSATPYLAIFGMSNQPILDPVSKIPLGTFVTDFEYIYKEDDSDTFSITIECDNPNIIDLPELGDKMPLILQWGWIYANGTSNSGPIRKVIIRDSEVKFTSSSVKVIIKGTDAFDLTKNMPSNVEEKTFIQWVKNNISGRFYVDIIDYKTKSKLYTEERKP